MVDSDDCRESKGGAMLIPTMAVILSVIKLRTHFVNSLKGGGQRGASVPNLESYR